MISLERVAQSARTGVIKVKIDQLEPVIFRFSRRLLSFQPVDILTTGAFANTWRGEESAPITMLFYAYGYLYNDHSSIIFMTLELDYHCSAHNLSLRRTSKLTRCPFPHDPSSRTLEVLGQTQSGRILVRPTPDDRDPYLPIPEEVLQETRKAYCVGLDEDGKIYFQRPPSTRLSELKDGDEASMEAYSGTWVWLSSTRENLGVVYT